MKNDYKIMMTERNAQLFELVDIITDNNYDIYSYVASKIFNKDYEVCYTKYTKTPQIECGVFLFIFQKPIDIFSKICYTIFVSEIQIGGSEV